jgi:hypothetical protein
VGLDFFDAKNTKSTISIEGITEGSNCRKITKLLVGAGDNSGEKNGVFPLGRATGQNRGELW